MPSTNRSLRERLIVKPGTTVDLAAIDAADTHAWTKDTAAPALAANLERLTELQERLWAEHRRRVLIVLQGIDASGKDGVVRHVVSAFHPLGVRAVGFGVPSDLELAHDYLWRVHAAVPGDGEIVVFNRSHYEDVLVVRVHALTPQERWARRYDQINAFERTLTEEGTTILKFFLYITREEQLERFRDRYTDRTRRWKFKVGDLAERERWDDYIEAYEDALGRCSTEAAPWFVIPANRKWFRDHAIAQIVADTLAALDPQYPVRDDLPDDLVLA